MVRESVSTRNPRFVPGALKGEDIYCQITSIKRNFVEAKLLKVNKKSKFELYRLVRFITRCGGCQIMHLHYDKQLGVQDGSAPPSPEKFAPAGYENYEIRPTIGMQEPSTTVLSFNSRLGNLKIGSGRFVCTNSHYLVELKTVCAR